MDCIAVFTIFTLKFKLIISLEKHFDNKCGYNKKNVNTNVESSWNSCIKSEV